MLLGWISGMGEGLTAFAEFLYNVFNSVISLFWVPATTVEGTTVAGHLSDFGALAAGVFGASFIFMGMRFLLKLLHLKF